MPMARLVHIPAAVAQLVERVLGKDEVMGSNPISSFGLSAPVSRPCTRPQDKRPAMSYKNRPAAAGSRPAECRTANTSPFGSFPTGHSRF